MRDKEKDSNLIYLSGYIDGLKQALELNNKTLRDELRKSEELFEDYQYAE